MHRWELSPRGKGSSEYQQRGMGSGEEQEEQGLAGINKAQQRRWAALRQSPDPGVWRGWQGVLPSVWKGQDDLFPSDCDNETLSIPSGTGRMLKSNWCPSLKQQDSTVCVWDH